MAFFFQEVVTEEKNWQDRFESIPQDLEEIEIYNTAGGEQLQQFSDMMIIDSFARLYNYTHDEVFMLDWQFVCTTRYMNNLKDHIQRQSSKERQRRNKLKNS